jgi:hypothetical protein
MPQLAVDFFQQKGGDAYGKTQDKEEKRHQEEGYEESSQEEKEEGLQKGLLGQTEPNNLGLFGVHRLR